MTLDRKQLIDLANNIESYIERLSWVAKYKLFVQSLEKLIINVEHNRDSVIQTYHNGIALILQSDNNRLYELNLSLSMIPTLMSLTPSKVKQYSSSFELETIHPLKRTAIIGDQSSQVTITRDWTYQQIQQLKTNPIIKSISGSETKFKQLLVVQKENKLITNSISDPVVVPSLRVKYQLNGSLSQNGKLYSLYRDYYSRKMNIPYNRVYTNVIRDLTHFNLKRKYPNLIKGYLIHPKILGSLIINYIYKYMNSKNNSIKWNSRINLYEEPQRNNGYSSELVDDLGVHTKNLSIIDNGELSHERIKMLKYRVKWYRPIIHSYQYPLTPSFTNLVLFGGYGDGESFVERSGYVIKIVSATSYLSGSSSNIEFIINAYESEIWKNGQFIAPGNNFTIRGNFNDLMTIGVLSSDLNMVVDEVIPTSVFTPWIFIKSEITRTS